MNRADLHALPGVTPIDEAATKDFVFQQTMFRIKDPQRSLAFYTGVLGMTLLNRLDFPDMGFSLYFLAKGVDPASVPDDPKERVEFTFKCPGTLELTHNHGTETQDDFAYHNGNSDPGKGFGHIGFEVADVDAACKRFEEMGVEFVKKPNDGKMKGLAFIKDPDGYWIEILNAQNCKQFV
ncbi:unnamed protein product [Pedinophyceae sp. YPF-701]|nr:unnamed protein product [Pedinophyceae sp. YPF-701]